MTLTLLLLVAVGVLRAVLLVAMAVASVGLMRRLSRTPPRRRASPALWAALGVVASSGTAMGLLVVRQVLVWVAGGEPWWFLLHRDPDLIGELGYSLASSLAGLGVLLLIRAVYAVHYRDAPGHVPRLLGGGQRGQT